MTFKAAPPVPMPASIAQLLEQKPLRMKPVLQATEKLLPSLLQQPDIWNGANFSHRTPVMRRLVSHMLDEPSGKRVFVNLHHFPAAKNAPEGTPHNHAGATAMRILSLVDGLSIQAAVRGVMDYADVQTLVTMVVDQILGLA